MIISCSWGSIVWIIPHKCYPENSRTAPCQVLTAGYDKIKKSAHMAESWHSSISTTSYHKDGEGERRETILQLVNETCKSNGFRPNLVQEWCDRVISPVKNEKDRRNIRPPEVKQAGLSSHQLLFKGEKWTASTVSVWNYECNRIHQKPKMNPIKHSLQTHTVVQNHCIAACCSWHSLV